MEQIGGQESTVKKKYTVWQQQPDSYNRLTRVKEKRDVAQLKLAGKN